MSDITDEMIERAAHAMLANALVSARSSKPIEWQWEHLLNDIDRETWRHNARRILEAGLAGRTVVELPKPNAWRNRLDGDMDIWVIDGWSVSAHRTGVSISMSTDGYGDGVMFREPDRARLFGIALIAAADRLASGSVGSETLAGGEGRG